MPDRFDRWMPALANLFAGVFLAVVFFRDGNEVTAAVVLGVLAVVAWRSSPLRRGAHTDHDMALTQASDGDVIVYWRPGCRHCAGLRRGLGSTADDVTWVNIWADDDAAAHVAKLRDGAHTVPTVLTGSGVLLEPSPDAIRSHLTEGDAPKG